GRVARRVDQYDLSMADAVRSGRQEIVERAAGPGRRDEDEHGEESEGGPHGRADMPYLRRQIQSALVGSPPPAKGSYAWGTPTPTPAVASAAWISPSSQGRCAMRSTSSSKPQHVRRRIDTSASMTGEPGERRCVRTITASPTSTASSPVHQRA